jgi:hypothetical protein
MVKAIVKVRLGEKEERAQKEVKTPWHFVDHGSVSFLFNSSRH